jgi:hypothetical protein
MWSFTPTENAPTDSGIVIPFFEDARADFAPYYSSDKSEQAARSEVQDELLKLGGLAVNFQGGYFTIADHKRYGYSIHFKLYSAPAVIRVAGLPIRKETPRRIEQVRIQALLNVRDWLKAAVTTQIFTPAGHPLTPFLLVDGRRTFIELMEEYARSGSLPQLPPVTEE